MVISEDLKFECQTSCAGKCCKLSWDGKADFVFLTEKDRKRLQNHLKQNDIMFAQYGEFSSTRFTNKVSRQWYLRNDGKQCPFLKSGKCSVYEARPTQCRTFPFWPELMVRITYDALKEYCPGIGKGFPVTHKLLSEQTKADKELCK